MARDRISFAVAVAAVIVLGSIGGLVYSQQQHIPQYVAAWVIAAIVLEICLYLVPGFRWPRQRLAALGWRAAAVVALTAPVPYAVYSVPLGMADWQGAAALLGLAALVMFWYVMLPRRGWIDAALLVLLAAVLLLKIFPSIYPRPVPALRVDFLGHLMWIRCGLLSILLFRGLDGIDFGYWPKARHWAVGLRNYLLFLPLGALLAWALGFPGFDPLGNRLVDMVLIAAGTFAGILWVVALSEEFFFRGMMQPGLASLLRSERAALLVISLLFGAVHLPFRGFPNWRLAVLAAVAGWFYGRAFLETRSVRAAMVTHALVATTWLVAFR